MCSESQLNEEVCDGQCVRTSESNGDCDFVIFFITFYLVIIKLVG